MTTSHPVPDPYPTSNLPLKSNSAPGELDFIWCEITRKCNLECVHCYADSSPHEALVGSLTLNHWMAVLSEAADLGCRKVQFIGGEPLIHPNLKEMVAAAHDMKFDFIEVYTNATRLDRQWCDFFKSCDVHVATSFYSRFASVHASITKSQSSFARTVAGIEIALASKLPIRVGIIGLPENREDADATGEFLRSLGVDDVSLDRTRLVGRGADFFSPQIGGEQQIDPYEQLCGACRLGRLAVTADGTVYPCVFSRFFPVGNVHEQNLANILDGKSLLRFRQATPQRPVSSRRADECTPDRCEPLYDCNPGCLPVEPDDDDDFWTGR